MHNRSVVYTLTHDASARQIIRNAQDLIAQTPTSPLVFFAPWGGEFWSLAYARDISGELPPNFQLLPNRANLEDAIGHAGRLYVFEHTFYNWNLDWWRKKLRGEVHLSAAGDEAVVLAKQPILSAQDLPGHNPQPIAMGDSRIVLRDWTLKPHSDGQWQISLYWQATARPDRDYSISLKASGRDVIAAPADIVAQSDSSAPVYGWYPTTRWSPGEIVRDDYVLAIPPDQHAAMIEVALYTQDSAGQFQDFGRQVIPLP